jgi:hypothetical protein
VKAAGDNFAQQFVQKGEGGAVDRHSFLLTDLYGITKTFEPARCKVRQ